MSCRMMNMSPDVTYASCHKMALSVGSSLDRSSSSSSSHALRIGGAFLETGNAYAIQAKSQNSSILISAGLTFVPDVADHGSLLVENDGRLAVEDGGMHRLH